MESAFTALRSKVLPPYTAPVGAAAATSLKLAKTLQPLTDLLRCVLFVCLFLCGKIIKYTNYDFFFFAQRFVFSHLIAHSSTRDLVKAICAVNPALSAVVVESPVVVVVQV